MKKCVDFMWNDPFFFKAYTKKHLEWLEVEERCHHGKYKKDNPT